MNKIVYTFKFLQIVFFLLLFMSVSISLHLQLRKETYFCAINILTHHQRYTHFEFFLRSESMRPQLWSFERWSVDLFFHIWSESQSILLWRLSYSFDPLLSLIFFSPKYCQLYLKSINRQVRNSLILYKVLLNCFIYKYVMFI